VIRKRCLLARIKLKDKEMKSMTGFGKATADWNNRKYTVEIRSVNSKQLDFNLRLPGQYRDKEHELKTFLGKDLERGKVDALLFYEGIEAAEGLSINKTLAKIYYNELKALADDLQAPATDLLALTLKMPEVMRAERPVVEEPEYNMIKDLFSAALGNFIQFRTDEGRSLRHALIVHIGTISSLLESVAAADLERIPQVRARISKGFKEFKEQVDQNRFEQELIYYIEKLDITEEKVRLKTHLDYFINTLEEPGSGRKLGFIAQEIGREINTIGSKANDAAIQKMVVQMKDELEKVKEQLLNVL